MPYYILLTSACFLEQLSAYSTDRTDKIRRYLFANILIATNCTSPYSLTALCLSYRHSFMTAILYLLKISLSVFAYRAYKIMKGEPYHK